MIELGFLSVALAMDATAVAAGIGATERSLRPILLGAFLFGVFQALMAGVGWWGGTALTQVALTWAPLVAFVLLVAIGLRMIRNAWTERDEHRPPARSLWAWLLLALATSLDALAAGITLPVLELPLFLAVVTIGVVTLVLSALGGLLGRVLGSHFGSRLEILGGLVLIGIGVHVLLG